jgi:hypothetical protein
VRHTEGVERLTAAIAGLLKKLGRKDAEAMAFFRPAAPPFPKCAWQFLIQQNRSRLRLDCEATSRLRLDCEATLFCEVVVNPIVAYILVLWGLASTQSAAAACDPQTDSLAALLIKTQHA